MFRPQRVEFDVKKNSALSLMNEREASLANDSSHL